MGDLVSFLRGQTPPFTDGRKLGRGSGILTLLFKTTAPETGEYGVYTSRERERKPAQRDVKQASAVIVITSKES